MHKPVLLHETVENLNVREGGTYLDCTGGGGGHAEAVAAKLGESGRLFVLDRDEAATERLRAKFAGDARITVEQANFRDFDEVMKKHDVAALDGLYADFGVSNFQLLEAERGFSFRKAGPLDMRMGPDARTTADDVVNNLPEETIANIIYKYGEEPMSRRIARSIVQHRAIQRIKDTAELAEIIKGAVPRKFHKPGIHPATRSFQAIRIYVNGELEAIEVLLAKLEHAIAPNGRVACISFHSLEDRLVKEMFARYGASCLCPPGLPACACGHVQTFKVLTRKPITPSEAEIASNPLSRSAKLRVVERLP